MNLAFFVRSDMDFWSAVPIDKRGQAYLDLANYQMRKHGLKLDEPKGMRGDEPPEPPVIDSPQYLEEEQADLEAFVAKPPESEEHMRET